MSEHAIKECIAELRGACRRPIDEPALDELVGWLRPRFEQILDHPDGESRWADCARQMRDNGRHLGALADFFGNHADAAIVGANELTRAFTMVRDACRVGAEPGDPGHPDRPAVDRDL